MRYEKLDVSETWVWRKSNGTIWLEKWIIVLKEVHENVLIIENIKNRKWESQWSRSPLYNIMMSCHLKSIILPWIISVLDITKVGLTSSKLLDLTINNDKITIYKSYIFPMKIDWFTYLHFYAKCFNRRFWWKITFSKFLLRFWLVRPIILFYAWNFVITIYFKDIHFWRSLLVYEWFLLFVLSKKLLSFFFLIYFFLLRSIIQQ